MFHEICLRFMGLCFWLYYQLLAAPCGLYIHYYSAVAWMPNQLHCLFKILFWPTSNKISKFRIRGLLWGWPVDSPHKGEAFSCNSVIMLLVRITSYDCLTHHVWYPFLFWKTYIHATTKDMLYTKYTYHIRSNYFTVTIIAQMHCKIYTIQYLAGPKYVLFHL